MKNIDKNYVYSKYMDYVEEYFELLENKTSIPPEQIVSIIVDIIENKYEFKDPHKWDGFPG